MRFIGNNLKCTRRKPIKPMTELSVYTCLLSVRLSGEKWARMWNLRAKLAISIVNGFSFMEHLSFDAFNEGTTFIESLENFKQRFGVYPKEVFADKIYRNRENFQFCKKNGIRFSGFRRWDVLQKMKNF